jgi:hypothetical protein
MSQEQASPEPPRSAGDDLVYSYKPSLMGAAWEFRLRPDALEWQAGRHTGRVPYDRIARVRLSFRPQALQTRRFITEIWPQGGTRLLVASTSQRSLFEHGAQDEAYGAFVRDLHRRVADAGAPVSLERGTNPLLYWPGVVVFAMMAVMLVYLMVRALQSGTTSAAILVLLFLGVLLWQSGIYFLRNRPGRYRPDALPPDLVPGG